MKRKIFRSLCILALLTILLTSASILSVMYNSFYNNMKQNAKYEAMYIAAALNNSGESYLSKIKDIPDGTRITLIDADGKVLFDNKAEKETIGNHFDRPEISDAFLNGHGEAVRLSDTLGSQTFYYALRLDNGTILRVARITKTVYLAILNYVPYIFVIILFILIFSMLLANWQTRKIVVPINSLDLENPLSNDVYDELSPLLARIAKQNSQIKMQIKTLKDKQEELAAITENMREGLVVLNAKSNILSINKSALKLLGVKGSDFLHKHILTVNRSLELQIAVDKSIKGTPCEKAVSIAERQYQFIANPVLVDNTVKGVVLLILDVTEKHAAEQMRREFSANVSHELKTPLTSISGYAEIMKEGLVKQDDIQQFSERIYVEANRLIYLVEDIIKLSRLDENNVEMPHTNVDLLDLSQEVCSRLLPQAEQRGIKLSVAGESAVITGVKHILVEMVYNLCINAIKYNRENGSVDVHILHTEKGVVLSVSDTGIGIPRDQQDRVFERFYRVDKSHSRETGGTGLGLSIVKHGAIYHNATIELESEVGKGTTIQITFPD